MGQKRSCDMGEHKAFHAGNEPNRTEGGRIKKKRIKIAARCEPVCLCVHCARVHAIREAIVYVARRGGGRGQQVVMEG